MTKPIKLYSHESGPNGWKVAIILEELGLPYETEFLNNVTMKQEPYESINPNGRIPSIIDPNNNDITLFESGAIIEYLIDTYDKDAKLTYTTFPEKYLLKSWLHFQMSGQGPYFGQLTWFKYLHSEKVPSAVERYAKEVKRVLGVVDSHLQKKGTEYLVGDKATYADLAWVPWGVIVPTFLLGDDVNVEKEFPAYDAWFKRLTERPTVKKVFDDKAKAMEAKKD